VHAEVDESWESDSHEEDNELVNKEVVERGIGRISGWALREHEIGDVDWNKEPEEVVHLKKKTQGTLFTFKVHGVKLNKFINSLERVKDKQEPINEFVGFNVLSWGGILSNSIGVFLDHGLVTKSYTGHCSSEYYRDHFVADVVVGSLYKFINGIWTTPDWF
jgi:hypothetical protein